MSDKELCFFVNDHTDRLRKARYNARQERRKDHICRMIFKGACMIFNAACLTLVLVCTFAWVVL